MDMRTEQLKQERTINNILWNLTNEQHEDLSKKTKQATVEIEDMD